MNRHLFLLAIFALVSQVTQSTMAADVVFDAGGFEDAEVNQPPQGWQAFHAESNPAVNVVSGGAQGSRNCLRSERSKSGGLTALSREFDAPQQRVMIEFSFAFAKTNGRTLNLWTHEPNGSDASQLNLCIQGGALLQFDGRTRNWEEITRDIRPTLDPAKPVWHRFRAIVDAKAAGIDFWISPANSRELPKAPITRQVYRKQAADRCDRPRFWNSHRRRRLVPHR